MPSVNVQTIKRLLSDAQKRELQDLITDLLVEVEGSHDREPLVFKNAGGGT